MNALRNHETVLNAHQIDSQQTSKTAKSGSLTSSLHQIGPTSIEDRQTPLLPHKGAEMIELGVWGQTRFTSGQTAEYCRCRRCPGTATGCYFIPLCANGAFQKITHLNAADHLDLETPRHGR